MRDEHKNVSRFDSTQTHVTGSRPYTRHMLSQTDRHQGTAFVAVLGIALLVSGCAKGIDWSDREKENAAHILASLQATSIAASIANEAGDAIDNPDLKNRLLQALRSAHLHAARVDDAVLDKLHPQLYGRFRLGYQPAVAAMIRSHEAGDPEDAADAAADIQAFMHWYLATRHTFRWWDEAMPL